MLLHKHCKRLCISSNKSSGSGWKTIQLQRGKQNHDCHIAWRTRELLLPVLLLCCSTVPEMADAVAAHVPCKEEQHRIALDLSGSRRTWQMQMGVNGESKNVTPNPLTATSFSGDTFTSFASSSPGSSFSLLSEQETESWTEQVLSKSGKLVDGYFRKSPSADSYPKDNKISYIASRKPPKPWWKCSISPGQWELPVPLPSSHTSTCSNFNSPVRKSRPGFKRHI